MTNLQNNFAGMEAEFAPGSIRGVRAWNVHPVHDELRGLTYPMPWGPGQNEARCYRLMPFEVLLSRTPSFPIQGHRVPEPECTCGFYAYFGGVQTYPGPTEFSPFVFGVIEAFGRVLIGTQGFRAEKARILALTSFYPAEMLRRYGNIPMFDNFGKMIAEFPPDMAESVGVGRADTSITSGDGVANTPPLADVSEPPERNS